MKTDWSNILSILAFIAFYAILIGKVYFDWDILWEHILVTLGMAIYFKADSVRDNVRAR